MPVKLPACEPCRTSKQACDHAKPCSRCQERGTLSACLYRARPFKKRRLEGAQEPPRAASSANPSLLPETPVTLDASLGILTEADTPEPSRGMRNYPNPGFLGSSSHTTFFEQLPRDTNDTGQLPDCSVDEEEIRMGANLIDHIHKYFQISSCVALVQDWIAGGVNLALAGPLVVTCAQVTEYVLSSCGTSSPAASTLARTISQKLFRNSCHQLNAGDHQSIAEWCSVFGAHNARWEMFGIFFAALAAATMQTPKFQPLYKSHQDQRDLQKLAVRFSDRCLDISLALDRLNDLQLLLQYENWISHSCLDGDQSYVSWRKLGDVISSLYALGYHERASANFLSMVSLREVAFARTFSGDTNVSLFLGRPARIDRKHCRWLPRQFHWSADAAVDYAAETQWSAICAVLKGEALDLFHEADYTEKVKKANLIRDEANLQWSSLPPHFRLETCLKDCHRTPKERDFLVSTLLNHMHVHFLLHLQLQVRVNEPGPELVSTSARMLSLVIESVLLKDTLAYSGTTLDWKVAYYGLAAAGIICLSLLKQGPTLFDNGFSKAQMIQDLNVLVAVVDAGVWIHPIDANYALLSRATLTIKSLLRRLLIKDARQLPGPVETNPSLSDLAAPSSANWNLWDNQHLQDFEVDFWLNLAEHPFLTETPTESLPTTQV
ncbi:hypothetical protein BU23DRAFT_576901 [Bimuria novae-zelandiae CBS 107.79]|uniref:Zn(2)-C6 fungal-type domain-containing protein n=1 Tax=Bimuria novae-zelandiae CBS 107.79 TaxID=1447943 RepID=A0A6A5VPR3_9PLEO|nr:hypothetical protein BU23DRAFT_576901 [Bimuria novae-zelandiae CBS 107.79]